MGNAKNRRKARAANKAKRKLRKHLEKFKPMPTSPSFNKHANFLAEISKQLLNSLGVPKEILTMPKPPSQFYGIRFMDVVGWEEVIGFQENPAKPLTIFKTGQVISLDPTDLRGSYNPDLIKSKDYRWLVKRFGLIQSIAGTALTTYQRPGILL